MPRRPQGQNPAAAIAGEIGQQLGQSSDTIQPGTAEVPARNAPTPDERLSRATSGDVPQIYFNGLLIGLSGGDVVIVLERNGLPVAALNASYTVAKTLAVKLGLTMSDFESKTGRTMLICDEVEAALAKKADPV